MEKQIGLIIAGVVGLLSLFALTPTLAGMYEDAQTVATSYEAVDTTEDWEQAIATATGYTISNGEVQIDSSTTVDTNSVDTSNYDDDQLVVEVVGVSGNVTAQVVDNSTDTVIDSVDVSDNETASVSISDYSADSYYITYDTGADGSATVDAYTVDGESPLDSTPSAALLLVFLIFFLAVGMVIWKQF